MYGVSHIIAYLLPLCSLCDYVIGAVMRSTVPTNTVQHYGTLMMTLDVAFLAKRGASIAYHGIQVLVLVPLVLSQRRGMLQQVPVSYCKIRVEFHGFPEDSSVLSLLLVMLQIVDCKRRSRIFMMKFGQVQHGYLWAEFSYLGVWACT